MHLITKVLAECSLQQMVSLQIVAVIVKYPSGDIIFKEDILSDLTAENSTVFFAILGRVRLKAFRLLFSIVKSMKNYIMILTDTHSNCFFSFLRK